MEIKRQFEKKSRIIALFLLIAIFSGCSASGPAFSPAPEPTDTNALLYVFRPSALAGAAVTYDILVDGSKIVGLKNNGYTWVKVTPGNHLVAIKGSKLRIKVPAESQKTYFARIGGRAEVVRNVFTLRLVDESAALPEISKTKYQKAIVSKE